MSITDWIVLTITLAFIVIYGIWKSRDTKNISGFLLADRQLPWYHVGLSVMATQASAITFLSAPGQAYSDGLRFIQFYFGLPFAMVVLCITFIPIFHKLNVYTAYEYLEKRFDLKTRTLTAFLFLLQRGLSTGITIYAPAIVLSTILHININYTILVNGLIVIGYTVYGGTKAVSYTQLLQMSIIFAGLFLAAYMVIHLLPDGVGFTDALHIAGKMDKTSAVNAHFDWKNKYTIWSGLIGGFFLQLSYFGTDQSQVGRYLTGSSVTQSRLGLLMNGLVKIPMQFLILLIGTLVFSFYQFNQPPVFFNTVEVEQLRSSKYKTAFEELEKEYSQNHKQKLIHINQLVEALHSKDEHTVDDVSWTLLEEDKKGNAIRSEVTALMKKNNPYANTEDTNYVFLNFVTQHLPVGVVGLLIAIIFLASMGSTASGLNSLASTSVVDFYKRFTKETHNEKQELSVSRWATVLWGIFCIVVAFFANHLGNLIEAVNILGSLFYGTILGIFLVAFYLKHINGTIVFYVALAVEVIVIYVATKNIMAFLWLNALGCLLVILFSQIIYIISKSIKLK